MTARLASATAAGFPRTACASKHTVRWMSAAAPPACCSPCPACRRRSVPVSRKCSTSCSTWAGSCASPVTASSPPPRSRSWSRRSTGSMTRCRRSRSSFSPGAGPAPPPVISPAPSRAAPSGACGRSPAWRRCAPRSRSISIACRICCSCWRGCWRGTSAAPRCCGGMSAARGRSERVPEPSLLRLGFEQCAESRPVERRPGIALAPGRNVAVAGDGCGRQRGIGREECRDERDERAVLRLGVRDPVGHFELDADRKILAPRGALVLGLAGMPGALPERHVLHDLPVAPDERVCGGDEALDLLEVRMDIGGQGSGEQPVDPRPAEFPGWQADAVHHQKFGLLARRARVEVGRHHLATAGLTPEPVIALSESPSAIAPAGLTRCFYADNGSSAVEVAVKMSFHYWRNVGRTAKRRFLTLSNSYHGETLGALAVGNVELYKEIYRPLLMEVVTVPSPDCYACEPGESWAQHSRRQFAHMEAALAEHAHEACAVIVEPLVQCAGGMRMYDPVYLTLLREACDRHQVHLIADEIAVGFGRTGTMFACEQAGIRPDFMCLSKGLTGGYLPLSTVMTTQAVYGAVYGQDVKLNCFLHR